MSLDKIRKRGVVEKSLCVVCFMCTKPPRIFHSLDFQPRTLISLTFPCNSSQHTSLYSDNACSSFKAHFKCFFHKCLSLSIHLGLYMLETVPKATCMGFSHIQIYIIFVFIYVYM